MVNFFFKSWWASTNYFFGSPSSENVIKLADVVVSPAVNMYQGGITVKYKAAYFLALEAESAASLIVIPALKKATVLLSVQQIYLGVAVLVGVIAFAMLVFYGGTPPPGGGGRLLDSPVSSVTSTSCGRTVNIEVQSSLPHSVIDTSTAVSSDGVTTVLADVEGLILSTQLLIDQVLLAELALTGIVDSALFEVGTSLVVASAAALTTSVLPEVAAATLPLVIEVQSSLPHSVIDTSTAVSSDGVTTVLADVEGLSLSMQPLIDQALLAEPALTGIVDSALFEVGTSLVVASAAALTTSVLPEVAAATLPLVPLVNTELGFLFVSMKNLQITIVKNYLQYEWLNSNGAPPLTDTIKFLNKPHMTIMRDQLLRMGYDLTEYYAPVQPLKDGAAKEPLGFFIIETIHNMLKTVTADFSEVRDNTPNLYNNTVKTVYKHLVNVVKNIDHEVLNKFPCRRP